MPAHDYALLLLVNNEIKGEHDRAFLLGLQSHLFKFGLFVPRQALVSIDRDVRNTYQSLSGINHSTFDHTYNILLKTKKREPFTLFHVAVKVTYAKHQKPTFYFEAVV